MNELQKQAIADAKIKLRNAFIAYHGDGRDEFEYEEFEYSQSDNHEYHWDVVSYYALCLATPQAHESVQNGTCDEVSDDSNRD